MRGGVVARLLVRSSYIADVLHLAFVVNNALGSPACFHGHRWLPGANPTMTPCTTLAMSALMSSGIAVVYGLVVAAANVPPCNSRRLFALPRLSPSSDHRPMSQRSAITARSLATIASPTSRAVPASSFRPPARAWSTSRRIASDLDIPRSFCRFAHASTAAAASTVSRTGIVSRYCVPDGRPGPRFLRTRTIDFVYILLTSTARGDSAEEITR
jgi:hypothetical protein